MPTDAELMKRILQRDGPDETLAAMERLVHRGFEAARTSGASLSPFIGESLQRPPLPQDDNDDAWEIHVAQLSEQLAGRKEYADADLGPQLLAVKSAARGSLDGHLLALAATRGVLLDLNGAPLRIRHGFRQGLSPNELFAWAGNGRSSMGEVALETVREGYRLREIARPKGFSVLARAMRSDHPGVVFGRAAAIGETDPLTDLDSALFVGVPPKTA